MAFATRIDLDDAVALARLDPQGMRRLVEGLPAQVAEAWAAGVAWAGARDLPRPERVLVAGLGGSAIGADVVATLALSCSTVPMQVVRGYVAPPLDAGTLLIGCSFSGNTAETIAALTEARGPGERLVLTTGGRISALAEAHGWPAFRYAFDGPPRSALGWSTFALLAVLARLGAIRVDGDAVDDLVAEMQEAAYRLRPEAPGAVNVAKQLAGAIAGRPVLVLGAGPLEVAARRWAGQLNENAKQWAVAGGLPEADHNLLVPLVEGQFPLASTQPLVVLLDAPVLDPRVSRHVALTADFLAEAGVPFEVVNVDSVSVLGAIMEACQLGDWVSLYTAALNEVDPMNVDTLDRFKARLATTD